MLSYTDSAVIQHDSEALLWVGSRFEILVVKVRFGKRPNVPWPSCWLGPFCRFHLPPMCHPPR